MKVYLAARYSRRLELCEYRTMLEEVGIEVTSRWLNGSHQVDNEGKHIGEEGEAAIENGEQLAAHFATEDIQDLDAGDFVVAFTETPRMAHPGRGGRHVEFGYALAKGIPVVIVGPRENVFCWLPEVFVVDDWSRAFAYLCGEKRQIERAS